MMQTEDSIAYLRLLGRAMGFLDHRKNDGIRTAVNRKVSDRVYDRTWFLTNYRKGLEVKEEYEG